MNAALVLTHNTLELTKKCVASIREQDIPCKPWIVDNGSTDGTKDWILSELHVAWWNWDSNQGVSRGWNEALTFLFAQPDVTHVLVPNSDTILPPWFFRRLLECDLPFVTGVSVGSMEEISDEPKELTMIEAPDFSAFLIRKDAWAAVGPFDENMVMYAQDLDYHLRAYRAGIHLINAQLPFYHQRSSTLNSAPSREKRLIEMRADTDRAVFAEKWGCAACSPEYEAMLGPDNFGIEKKA